MRNRKRAMNHDSTYSREPQLQLAVVGGDRRAGSFEAATLPNLAGDSRWADALRSSACDLPYMGSLQQRWSERASHLENAMYWQQECGRKPH